MRLRRPPVALSTAVLAALTAAWIYMRLIWFGETVLPLTFVLPLLACIWSGRRWHVWTMALAFATAAIWKMGGSFSAPPDERLLRLGSILFNILLGAIVVHVLIVLRMRVESHLATITAQNAELEAQAEELSQQNEEIRAQAEELTEQNEELEAQSEESARQNEDLLDLSQRLAGREEILQGLLKSARERAPMNQGLEQLCRHTLAVLGSPAQAVAVLEQDAAGLRLEAQARSTGIPPLPATWPVAGSIAEVVLRENRTAYVSDTLLRPDLKLPAGISNSIRSLLATPLPHSDGRAGLLVACSREPAHWTDEQFRMLEWISAQTALVVETLSAQKAIADHSAALEAANRSKDEFLAMLSHELRTPLTPVLAAAGALATDRRIPDDARAELAMIRRNAAIQKRLIDDLLDLTRISRGKIDLDRRALPAGALLRDSATIVSGDMDAKSQRIDWDLDGIDDCTVEGDGARLQQVFWNILRNAIKFSPPASCIHIRARCESSLLRVSIRDEGVGIAPADQGRIFLPFEQTLDGPRRAVDGGLGLGLAIAKAIVEAHGGRIRAHSEGAGLGATFEVELPVTKDEQTTPSIQPAAAAAPSAPPPAAVKILLVEDHGDTGQVLKRILQLAGYTVTHAETGAAAWKAFRQDAFDLVVSDIGLPDESGLALFRRMRELRPDQRGVCLSGYGMEDDVAACKQAGFREHLAKPVDVDRLLACVARVAAER
ncbi:MAG: ATP-binding protein [Terrimicrobiaceae bacterium]|nr:ATP-binding protein [Terrimicrobiaceae bacterium]